MERISLLLPARVLHLLDLGLHEGLRHPALRLAVQQPGLPGPRLEMRNPLEAKVRSYAIDFVGLVIGCIEADFLQLLSVSSTNTQCAGSKCC